jgi:Skp family chaperone for outer membrane proteins
LARERSAAREVAALKQLRAEAQAAGDDLQRLRTAAAAQAREEAAARAQAAAEAAAERQQLQREASAAAEALARLQEQVGATQKIRKCNFAITELSPILSLSAYGLYITHSFPNLFSPSFANL